jgi:hypothetical protein
VFAFRVTLNSSQLVTSTSGKTTAAHYTARHQATAEETLWWHQEALRRADASVSFRVSGFYPSLHLNAAHALEQLGRMAEAYQHYCLAAKRLDALSTNGYTAMIRTAVTRGQERAAPR